MSRALLRSVLELRTPVTRLPPTFLLPMRTTTPSSLAARFLHQTTQIVDPLPADASAAAAGLHGETLNLFHSQQQQRSQQRQQREAQAIQHVVPTARLPTAPDSIPTGPLSESVRTLLPLLAAQSAHYVTVHIHGRPYLVTEGDVVRLPFLMPDVEPGDVLRLNRASVVGSRDYTIKGEPYVDERLFECRAVVTGTEAEPMRIMIKKKQRCRRKKHVFSKHKYTMLCISDLRICTEALDAEV